MSSIEANIRDNSTKGQLNAIRNSGNVPAIIYGGKDKLARFNPECDLLKNIDIDKKVHIMPETGHFPFFERPVEFNSLIRKVINL